MAVNLSFIGGAGWQFFDDNGDPLSGGKIYTYEAGTTTPLVTYTSRDGIIPNANPIILDAAGRTPQQIWSIEGILYKYVIKTSADTLIRTWDNIGGSVVASNLAQDLANTSVNSKGDALIGFRQSNAAGFLSGATARTVNDKFQEFISVKDFGAVGDGVTDDSAAIQSAVDTIQNLGGGTVVFPVGQYYVGANTITIPKYVEVQSDANAVLLQSAAATGTLLVIEGRSFSETIRRPRHHKLPSLQKGAASGQPLWNSGSDTSSLGLHIKGCSDDTFTLRAVAYFYRGILMDADYLGSFTLSVNNTVFLGNVRNCYQGLWLENGANQNTFIAGTIQTDNAWVTAGTTYITLKSSEANINTFVGTNIEGFGSSNLKAVVCETISNTFVGCRLEGLQAGALTFTSASSGNSWIGGSVLFAGASNGRFDAVVSDAGFGNLFQWSGISGGKFVAVDNAPGAEHQALALGNGTTIPSVLLQSFGTNRLYLTGTSAIPLVGIRNKGQYHQEKVEVTSGTTWTQLAANYVVANYSSPTTVTSWTSAAAASDVSAFASVISVNTNLTLQHTASPAANLGRFVLKSGSNLNLSALAPVLFMSYDGNWYQV